MLRIPRPVVDSMIAHARRVAPEEACGVLAGLDDLVSTAYEAENLLHSPVEYLINPKDHLRIINKIFAEGLDDLAYYHSHPTSRAYPSATDVARVRLGRSRLVILSLQNPDLPAVRSFFVEAGGMDEEPVQIVEQGAAE